MIPVVSVHYREGVLIIEGVPLYMYKICTFNSGKLSITNMAHALSEPFTNEISTPPTYFKLTNGLRPWDHALTAGESAVMRRDFS